MFWLKTKLTQYTWDHLSNCFTYWLACRRMLFKSAQLSQITFESLFSIPGLFCSWKESVFMGAGSRMFSDLWSRSLFEKKPWAGAASTKKHKNWSRKKNMLLLYQLLVDKSMRKFIIYYFTLAKIGRFYYGLEEISLSSFLFCSFTLVVWPYPGLTNSREPEPLNEPMLEPEPQKN